MCVGDLMGQLRRVRSMPAVRACKHIILVSSPLVLCLIVVTTR